VSALDAAGNESPPRAQEDAATTDLAVAGPFPHPVRASCRFEISVPVGQLGERLDVRIVDAAGRTIRTLVDEDARTSALPILWDRRDDDGAFTAPGFYLLVVRLGGKSLHRRIYLEP
jgi:hypothetical protein